MIGKTNIPMGMSKGETVSILLKTNQSSNDDLNGVNVVVSYDDESHEYAYNGQFSVEIPNGKSYTVTFGEVDGYKTPSSVTYTAVKGFSRSIEVTYYGEKVTVDVSAEGGASVDGNVVKVVKLPSDDGVYILDTNGIYWNPNLWDGSATPSCIAVISEGISFGIALEQKTYISLGDDSIKMPDIEPYSSVAQAIGDFNGKNNTENLKKYWDATDTTTAFGYVCSYVFPDGRKGYLGSMGEYYVLSSNISTVNRVLSVLDKSLYFTQYLWSSNAYEVSSAPTKWWYYQPQGGTYGTLSASSGTTGSTYGVAIALCSLENNEEYPITNGKASFSVPYDETYTVSLSDMDGYTAPESQSYTASQPTREISMEYKKAVEHVIVNVSSDDYTDMDGYKVYVRPNIANGVYIQDVDGNLYTESEWDTMKVANGIAVVTDECSFVIALENDGSSFWDYMGSSTSLTTTTFDSEAWVDYNGQGNTEKMIATASDDRNAAVFCSNYIFPNGQSGYLGAAGEWMTVAGLIDEINGLVDIVGGSLLYQFTYLTSTQYSSSKAWAADVINTILDTCNVYSYQFVRAFAELGSSYTITNGKVEFDVPTGVDYVISVEDIDGYTTPEPQSFVAGVGTRTVDMVYKTVKLGVFIATQAGELIDPNNWTSSSGTAVGVAVCTENSQYIIGRTSYHGNYKSWSSSTTIDMSNVPSSTYASTIATYYDGVSYTDAMLGYNSSTSYSAGFARSNTITFGNTVLSGYLGSAGEWMDAVNNHQAVMDAFEKLGETFVADGYYKYFWTSCEYNSTTAWCAYWYEDSNSWGLNSYSKSRETSLYYTVPFFKI